MTDQPTRQHFLPAFIPVPREKDRSNGWKPEVQRAFIEALAETGSVKSAARRVARADHGAYLLRRHPDAQEFRRAWDAALDIGMRRIEDVAMDRALNGVEQPVYSYGKIVGSRTVYNDRLLMFMLRNRAPERFTGGKAKAPNAVDQMQLKRLKQQWHQEWQRQHAMESAERSRARGDDLLEQINTMHRRWFLQLGPQTRAAYRSFRETEIAEAQAQDELLWAMTDAETDCEELTSTGASAEQAQAAEQADARAAEAEYAEWFSEERRARISWVIDVVFGAVSAVGDEGDGEENL